MKPALRLAFLIAATTSIALGQVSDAPAKVADRKFWAITSWNVAASFTDGATTVLQVGHTKTCPLEVESPILYGRNPDAGRTGAIMGGLLLATALASYEAKKHQAHLWKIPLWPGIQSSVALAHTLGAAHNLLTCH